MRKRPAARDGRRDGRRGRSARAFARIEDMEVPFLRRTHAPRGGFSTRPGPSRLLLAGDPVRAPRAAGATTPCRIGRAVARPLGRRVFHPFGLRVRMCSVAARSFRSRRRFGSPAERASHATGQGDHSGWRDLGGLIGSRMAERRAIVGVGGVGRDGSANLPSLLMGEGGSRRLTDEGVVPLLGVDSCSTAGATRR